MNHSILSTIGNTPLVRLKRYEPNKKVHILAKLEGNNPGGSIKDRIALSMMNAAQKQKLLKKSKIIIEATSGNTGIGLAMIAAIKGYRFTAVMPESASIERRKIMKRYGAKLILTDGKKGTNYAIQVAHQILKDKPNKYIMLDQFQNQANLKAHFETTGPEIINKLPKISHFVAGVGTGGTLMGVGNRLKSINPKIKLIGIEPQPNSKIQGLRNMQEYVPPIYKEEKLDEKYYINDEPAFSLAKDIYKTEGISAGISSGAALWGAIKVAKKTKNATIVTIFPDRGDRYTSTKLFS